MQESTEGRMAKRRDGKSRARKEEGEVDWWLGGWMVLVDGWMEQPK
jgi:hypothetical protein